MASEERDAVPAHWFDRGATQAPENIIGERNDYCEDVASQLSAPRFGKAEVEERSSGECWSDWCSKWEDTDVNTKREDGYSTGSWKIAAWAADEPPETSRCAALSSGDAEIISPPCIFCGRRNPLPKWWVANWTHGGWGHSLSSSAPPNVQSRTASQPQWERQMPPWFRPVTITPSGVCAVPATSDSVANQGWEDWWPPDCHQHQWWSGPSFWKSACWTESWSFPMNEARCKDGPAWNWESSWQRDPPDAPAESWWEFGSAWKNQPDSRYDDLVGEWCQGYPGSWDQYGRNDETLNPRTRFIQQEGNNSSMEECRAEQISGRGAAFPLRIERLPSCDGTDSASTATFGLPEASAVQTDRPSDDQANARGIEARRTREVDLQNPLDTLASSSASHSRKHAEDNRLSHSGCTRKLRGLRKDPPSRTAACTAKCEDAPHKNNSGGSQVCETANAKRKSRNSRGRIARLGTQQNMNNDGRIGGCNSEFDAAKKVAPEKEEKKSDMRDEEFEFEKEDSRLDHIININIESPISGGAPEIAPEKPQQPNLQETLQPGQFQDRESLEAGFRCQ